MDRLNSGGEEKNEWMHGGVAVATSRSAENVSQ